MANIAVCGLCGMSLFMRVPHFPVPGETLEAASMINETGGKGFNQAIAAARVGASVSYLGAIGDDAEGEVCKNVMVKEGIDATFVRNAGKRTAFAAILVDDKGENQVIEHLGAELTEQDVYAFEEKIKSCDILLLQHEVPVEVNTAAIRIAEKYGKRVILNPAPARAFPDELKHLIFAVTPNETEAKAINASDFANCIGTHGSKGCSDNGTLIPSIAVKAVDTTGAGDTFNGVFTAKYAETGDMILSAHWAVAASGLSVSKPHVLNAIPQNDEIIAALKENGREEFVC